MARLELGDVVARFEQTFAKSLAKRQEVAKHIPGGYSRHPLTFGPHALYVERGSGAYVETIDGVRCIGQLYPLLAYDRLSVLKGLKELEDRQFLFFDRQRGLNIPGAR